MTAPTSIFRTSTFKLALVIAASIAALATVVVALLYWRTTEQLVRPALQGLDQDSSRLRLAYETGGISGLESAIKTAIGTGARGRYLLSDATGKVLFSNIGSMPQELRPAPRRGTFVLRSTAQQGHSSLAVGMSVPLRDGGVLVVAREIEAERALLDGVRQTMLLAIGLMSLAAIAAGLLASRYVLGRVEAVSRASHSIMQGDMSRRLPIGAAGDEFDGLSTSVNAMLDRIEQLMQGLKEVSDNIAHDLRTPLTRLRGRAEAALGAAPAPDTQRAALGEIIEEADELIRMFNALLLIARLEAGAARESFARINLADVVTDAVELYEPVAEAAGARLSLAIEGPVSILGNRELIGQAVANLVDNAIKYACLGPGKEEVAEHLGCVRVTLRRTAAGVRLAVADRGPGIPVEHRQRVLRRFVRLEASRSLPGTGLGLSLVAAVARVHGGSIDLSDNDPGLEVVLTLPCAHDGRAS